MSTEWASQFYTSTHWKKCREGYISYRRGLCEECLKNGIIKSGTQVHHKIPLTVQNITNPNITLSWKNLELLCDECHISVHEKLREKKKTEHRHKRFIVNKDGSVEAKKSADRVTINRVK